MGRYASIAHFASDAVHVWLHVPMVRALSIQARERRISATFVRPVVSRDSLPACVLTCPAEAKIFGDLEDASSDVYRLVYREGARRIQTNAVSIGPNVYYTGTPEHLELQAASFAPVPPRTIAAGVVWGAVAKKLVLLAVGATFAGQAIAFFRQLAVGEKRFED